MKSAWLMQNYLQCLKQVSARATGGPDTNQCYFEDLQEKEVTHALMCNADGCVERLLVAYPATVELAVLYNSVLMIDNT
ncbi:hypothetical protein PsorP6_002735 [Peronosclerospora sorghi]|uniref:Uncharacterized protein n=1 Tax=Peronosclerospora sorghi TaxID=230839 RepID=A0ACC0WY22_9STRA|nr:hypothetical protein PsorP6_002735 [Peronosclerospora sorghi]